MNDSIPSVHKMTFIQHPNQIEVKLFRAISFSLHLTALKWHTAFMFTFIPKEDLDAG